MTLGKLLAIQMTLVFLCVFGAIFSIKILAQEYSKEKAVECKAIAKELEIETKFVKRTCYKKVNDTWVEL